MMSLLNAAYPFVKDGKVAGIRISTRPDAINEDILNLLKKFGVTAIELGAQSMSDRVLGMNNRGHKCEDVKNASKLIKSFGFSLGLQMMTGLYGSDDNSDINTAEELIKLSPETVRIYPTIVLKDTDLEAFFAEEFYKDMPEFAYRLKVRGGLTGYAQIYGKYNTNAYDKLRLDMMYIENYSLLLDIKLIILTLRIIFSKDSTEGVDVAAENQRKAEQLLQQIHESEETEE